MLWQEIVLKNENTFLISYEQFLQKNLIGLLYFDPIANLCISYDPTLFYSVSFLFCIFLLYRTDPQVEVQIRILLKEAAIVSKMQIQAITLWFPEHKFKENFYLGFFY